MAEADFFLIWFMLKVDVQSSRASRDPKADIADSRLILDAYRADYAHACSSTKPSSRAVRGVGLASPTSSAGALDENVEDGIHIDLAACDYGI
jgi:hypothetical protein